MRVACAGSHARWSQSLPAAHGVAKRIVGGQVRRDPFRVIRMVMIGDVVCALVLHLCPPVVVQIVVLIGQLPYPQIVEVVGAGEATKQDQSAIAIGRFVVG